MASAPHGGVLVHGGCTSSCCYAPEGDLWAWSQGSWTNVSLSAGAPAPAARLYHGASPVLLKGAQPGTGTVASLVFGGTDLVTGFLSDAWLLTATLPTGAGVHVSSSPAAAWLQVPLAPGSATRLAVAETVLLAD